MLFFCSVLFLSCHCIYCSPSSNSCWLSWIKKRAKQTRTKEAKISAYWNLFAFTSRQTVRLIKRTSRAIYNLHLLFFCYFYMSPHSIFYFSFLLFFVLFLFNFVAKYANFCVLNFYIFAISRECVWVYLFVCCCCC
jgi:hypothetical protein